MEWQRHHKRRVDRAHGKMVKKINEEKRKNPARSNARDARIADIVQKNEKYTKKQFRKAEQGRTNRNGSIVGTPGDTGCSVVAVIAVAGGILIGVLAGWKGIT